MDIPYSRVWSHKNSSNPVNILKAIGTQSNAFDYSYSLLFSDNRYIKMKNPTYNKKKINNKKNSKFLKYISSGSKKILNKAYSKINFMKNETKILQKLNSLSLQKTSKAYFRTSRPKNSYYYHSLRNRVERVSSNFKNQKINLSYNNTIKILSKNSFHNSLKKIFEKKIIHKRTINDKNELNNLYTNENSKENASPKLNLLFSTKKYHLNSLNKNKKINYISLNNNKILFKGNFNQISPMNLLVDKVEEKYRNLINIDIPKLYSLNKNKHINLSRLNNEYRVQMNKSLHHYNPENHLKELNIIQRDDISVRQNMEDIKLKINQKINDRCKGLYFKKEYLKLKEENEKEKNQRPSIKKAFPDQIPFNILFKDKKRNKKMKIFPNGYKVRAFYDYCTNYDRMQKAKESELFEFGTDLLFGHFQNRDYDLFNNSLEHLFNSLEIEPIIKYIDKFKHEKSIKDKNKLKERINNFFPSLTESEKKIKKIEQHKIAEGKEKIEEKNILEKINDAKKLLNLDNK